MIFLILAIILIAPSILAYFIPKILSRYKKANSILGWIIIGAIEGGLIGPIFVLTIFNIAFWFFDYHDFVSGDPLNIIITSILRGPIIGLIGGLIGGGIGGLLREIKGAAIGGAISGSLLCSALYFVNLHGYG